MNIRAIRLSVVLGGAAAVYLLLGLTGFGPALARAGAVIATAYGAMAQGSLGNPGQMITAIASGDNQAMLLAFYPILESLVAATPYILSGLAVTVGLRGGVFNIGVEGQLFMGAIVATYIGYAVKGLPSALHITLALSGAALGGALWALIPAVLKVRFGAHEVINTIMMNYIAFRLSEWLLIGPMTRPGTSQPVSPIIEPTAELPRLFDYPSRFHVGFFLALALALFVYWFLFRTTFGLEIRSVGANPYAARYAGMSISRTIILTMCLSGALAGIAGANELLGVNHTLTSTFSPGYGFDSIALALLGGNHPLGVVLAALLFGTLRSGGTRMQNLAKIPVDIISVVQALVIVFVAAPAIVRALYHIKGRGKGLVSLTRGWGK
jgi:simple sugar transport system permease protein